MNEIVWFEDRIIIDGRTINMCEITSKSESILIIQSNESTKKQSWRILEGLLLLPAVVLVIIDTCMINQVVSNHAFSLLWVKDFYLLNTLYFPWLIILVSLLVWNISRRKDNNRQLQRYCMLFMAIAVIPFFVYLYATHYEPYQLTLETVTFHTPKIEQSVDILHITDIQSSAVGSYEETIFQRIRDIDPDMIVFTGDLLQPLPPATWETEFPKIAELFRMLSPPLGIYLTIGNTDDDSFLEPDNAELPMKVLINQEATIPVGDREIRLFSLYRDDSWDSTPQKAVDWFEGTKEGDFTILIGHHPNFMNGMKDYPIDLCLAGHTHGGQIRFPILGVLDTASTIPLEWARGFRQVGKTQINISAGTGCEHYGGLPPIRFLCPPSMTLIQLRSE